LPSVAFEPAIPANDTPQSLALDRSAIAIPTKMFQLRITSLSCLDVFICK
jgi:hypothetical protein